VSLTALNIRGKKILQAIVESYIQTAAPVSSQAITRRLRLRLSTATVRNIMAELDELGFIWQPHTSAGRIPTDRGYRYYIDSILEPQQLSLRERELIQQRYPRQSEAVDEFLTGTLRILSGFCGYTSLAFSSFGRARLYVERVSCILEQPEFQNTHKLQMLLRTFEEEEPLLKIMRDDLNPDGVKVHIGGENPCQDIQECSLVIANFKIKDKNIGALGIIGPRRMLYPKVMSIVGYMARALSERIVRKNYA